MRTTTQRDRATPSPRRRKGRWRTSTMTLVFVLLGPTPVAAARAQTADRTPGRAAPAAVAHDRHAGAAPVRSGDHGRNPTWRPPSPGSLVRAASIPTSEWAAGHRGIDFAAEIGTRITTPAAGTVSFVGQVAGRPVVVIEHPGGLRTSLEPVAPTVEVGTSLVSGATVGILDPSPGHCAPAACVHWGVRLGERYIDPALLLSRPRIILLPPRPHT
ncbi:M23 family metallopeptidase [Sanguibacter sp. A247]|uniref:M23 family metallopeptidase n=1 Tax=unclassified Sanguibacter TaxID=2645534 RepID=UPI003FD70365